MTEAAGVQEQTSQKPVGVTTDVLVVGVVDRSGSMSRVRDETIELWNGYQRGLAEDTIGETWLVLIGFDDQIEVWADGVPIAEVPYLTDATYVPRGMTALNDAIATAIRRADAKLIELGRDDVKVLVPILTDGRENDSREFPGYGNSDIKAMIEQREAGGNFTFTFLSADLRSTPETVAAAFAIPVGNFAYFSKDKASMDTVSAGLTNVTKTYRRGATGQSASLYSDAGETQDFRTEDGDAE